MTGNPSPDLDKVIVNAVNARVEAEVVKALSGDETIGRMVTAALMQPVKVGGDFSRTSQPFLTSVLHTAIQDATKAAVAKLLVEEVGSIEYAVRLALRRDIDRIASTLTESLVSAAGKAYGIEVKLDLKMPM